MPAGRVSDCNHTAQIEIQARGKGNEMIGACGNVIESSGPAATGIADPAVLQIPRCEPCMGQCFTDRPDVFQIVLGSPKSSMNNNCDGIRSSRFRNSNFSVLIRIVSVWNPFHGYPRRF